MDIENITPDSYKKIDEKKKMARLARDAKIRQQRAEDPDYWTLERLAEHWHTTKQNIDYIINGDPRKR